MPLPAFPLPDYAKLLGAIFGDGWTTIRGRESACVGLSVSNEYPAWLVEAERLFMSVFGRMNRRASANAKTGVVRHEFSVTTRELFAVFRLQSKYTDGQLMPPDWISCDRELRRQFICGLVETDGSFRPRTADDPAPHFCFTQKDKHLTDWLAAALVEEGFTPHVYARACWTLTVGKRDEVRRLGEWLDSAKWQAYVSSPDALPLSALGPARPGPRPVVHAASFWPHIAREEQERWRELRRVGLPLREIARGVNRSTNTVHRVVRDIVPERADVTAEEMGLRLRPTYPKNVSVADVQAWRDAYASGASIKDLMTRFSAAESVVWYAICDLYQARRERRATGGDVPATRKSIADVLLHEGVALTRENIASMSDSERTIAATSVLAALRADGFPYPRFSQGLLRQDLERVRRATCRLTGDTLFALSRAGSRLFRHFSPHYYTVRTCSGRRSVQDVFADDNDLLAAICNRMGVGGREIFTLTSEVVLRGIMSSGLGPRISTFSAALARFICETYAPGGGLVYDFAAGFGHRLMGAAAAGCRYVGVDPWEPVVPALTELMRFIEADATLHTIGSEHFCPPELVGTVDLAFSSPPYFDAEVYCDAPTQAYAHGYAAFLAKYWAGTCANLRQLLRLGGTLALNVCEEHDGHPLARDMVEIAKKHDFALTTTLRIRRTRLHLARRSETDVFKLEPIFIFRRT